MLDVIDRHSGTHRAIGPVSDNEYGGGVISSDGALAAAVVTQTAASDNHVVLHLIDLGSGTDRATRVALSGRQDPRSAMTWSPDNRWLFVADAAGHIVAVDRAGHARTLDTRLPAIVQLAMR
jgi:hypothetical protein